MSSLKAIILVFITSVLAFAKVGYSAPSDSYASLPEKGVYVFESENLTTFHSSSAPLEHQLLGIDLEENEDEDDKSKKKSANNYSQCQFTNEPIFKPSTLNQGGISGSKGISETQSIRLHLVIRKIQV